MQVISELLLKLQNRLFNWFDEELKELCDVDVYSHPFDKDKGYSIINENGVEILLLKTEKLSNLTDVIKDFANIQQFELLNENIGEKKNILIYIMKLRKR